MVSLMSWWDRLVLDVRHSLRVLRKAPAFTTIAILSLALGIGANTAIFSIVYAVMLKTLPVEDPQRLVQLSIGERQTIVTNPIWEALRDREQVFDGAFAYGSARFDLSSGGEKQPVSGLYVSGDFFKALGVPAFAGRTLTREDDKRGGGTHGTVAVLSHAFWKARYQGSANAIGSSLRLDGHIFTIVGVTPPEFFGVTSGSTFDVAVPIATQDIIRGKDSMLDRRSTWWLRVVGRLKPGESLEHAQAGLRAIQPQVREATVPPHYTAGEREGYLAGPAATSAFTLLPASTGPSSVRTRYSTALLTLTGAVALVLLIACANLANLLLARASARRKEFAVRLALGASRARLVRQLLTESLLLAIAGAALGLLFAQWASRLIVSQMSSARAPIFLDLSIDRTVLGFTIAAAALTTLIFGLAPAFRSTNLSANALLRGSGRSIAAGWRGFGIEKLLVVIQIAFSLVLIFGAALFVRSFNALSTLDPGFDRHQVLIVGLDARRANFPEEQRPAEFARLLEGMRAVPGVKSAAALAMTSIDGGAWTSRAFVRDYQAASDQDRRIYMNRVSPDYFATMGAMLRGGRDFNEHDTLNAPQVAIVNEAFARKFMRGGNPIGQSFLVPGDNNEDERRTLQIVGMVKDMKYVNLRAEVPETVFVPMAQEAKPGNYPNFAVRGTSGDVRALTRGITAAARGIHPELGLEFRVFDTMVKESLSQERLIAMLSGFFGALALLVAGIGLYGVMSLAVSRRRQEIGIRMALGAHPSWVVGMVLRDVAVVTIAGLAVGTLSGALSGHLVTTLLFGLEPNDVATWLGAIAALASAAALAGYLPARRAARVDPMTALREE
jgi:putative ABC transport system permease protein